MVFPSLDEINSMPVFEQIKNIDTNINAIIERLEDQEEQEELDQAQNDSPDQQSPVESADDTSDTSAESDDLQENSLLEDESTPSINPDDDSAEASAEELLLESLLLEMQSQNESLENVTESLDQMIVQNEISNHADHVLSIYGIIVIPALLIIMALNKMIRPFL